MPVYSFIKHFRREFEYYIEHGHSELAAGLEARGALEMARN